VQYSKEETFDPARLGRHRIVPVLVYFKNPWYENFGSFQKDSPNLDLKILKMEQSKDV
jgi:hypothetical protein